MPIIFKVFAFVFVKLPLFLSLITFFFQIECLAHLSYSNPYYSFWFGNLISGNWILQPTANETICHSYFITSDQAGIYCLYVLFFKTPTLFGEISGNSLGIIPNELFSSCMYHENELGLSIYIKKKRHVSKNEWC